MKTKIKTRPPHFMPVMQPKIRDFGKFEKSKKFNIEYPQYTRPEEFKGLKVPEILLSGNHEKIRLWRQKQSK